jgi:3-oxoacyl-(acyl-carrier-protein) synthase
LKLLEARDEEIKRLDHLSQGALKEISAKDCDIKFAVSNSVGFGGTNASLVIAAFKD